MCQFRIDFRKAELAAYARVECTRKMNQDVLDAPGISPVVVPIVATAVGIGATICAAETVPGSHGSRVLGNCALCCRLAIVIKKRTAYARPAPLVVFLHRQFHGQYGLSLSCPCHAEHKQHTDRFAAY